MKVSVSKYLLIGFLFILFMGSGMAHVVNTSTFSQNSADSGALSGSTDWEPLMSEEIQTEGGDVFIDFQTSTYGCNHNTWAVRLKVNGEEETLIRQGDSDASNQKMHDFFDIVRLAEGKHDIEIEWKLYEGHTWRVDKSGDNYDCGVDRGDNLQLYDDARIQVIEFNDEADWMTNETREATTEGNGEWGTILSETKEVGENNVLLAKSFISAFHPHTYDDTHGYTLRLLVDGEEVSRSSTSESNVFYNIGSLLHSERFNSEQKVEVKLQWKGDSRVDSSGFDEYILGGNADEYDSSFPEESGSHARLSLIEFESPVDYQSVGTDAGSAPSNWGKLDELNIDVENPILFTQSHISADISNDNDYFLRTLLDGTETSRQTTGVSDDSGHDNMLVSSIDEVESGTHTIESQWQTEGGTNWENSELVALGLRQSPLDIKRKAFTEVGEHTWEVPQGVNEVEVLVVGGGGSGGLGRDGGSCVPGSGGGAGGVVYRNSYIISDSEISVKVGAGGSSVSNYGNTAGLDGEDSVFGQITALGGGGGGTRTGDSTGGHYIAGRDGGSGGGGNHNTEAEAGEGLQQDSESGGFGNDGGWGYITGGEGGCEAGAGGGAGEPGDEGFQGVPAHGGDGEYFGHTFGEQYGEAGWFAGGGGMGLNHDDEFGEGGLGGGGTGGPDRIQPESAMSNTGGGGAGGANGREGNTPSGAGGSGIVIVQWSTLDIPICDRRGPINECISNSTHDVSGQDFSLDEIFESEASAVFEAFDEWASISVSNSSRISGLWQGSLNISSDGGETTRLKDGAEFKPDGGRIIIK